MNKDPSALNFLGPEFLSWLYFYIDAKNGEFHFSEYSKTKVTFEDAFRMCIGNRAALRPLIGTSASVTVTGTALDDSGEVLQAFRAGALVDSLSLEIHFSQSVYTFIVNAKDASISQFRTIQPFAEKSPSTFAMQREDEEEMDSAELEDEANVLVRMAALDETETILDALYKHFLERRLHQGFVSNDLANMRRVVSEGLEAKLPPSEQRKRIQSVIAAQPAVQPYG